MNGVFKVIVLVFLVTAALSRSPSSAVNIGKCSVSEFISGGHSCQRTMTMQLKQNPQRSCSVEYNNLKQCLNDHVTDCVKDDSLLNGMAGNITNLLLLMAYNCGNQRVDTSDINDLLWIVTKCDQRRLDKTFDCWNAFDSDFKIYRNNPSKLCDSYAKAKRDCTLVAMEACEGLCQYLKVDNYNTFCSETRSDPLGNDGKPLYGITSVCSDFHAKLQCTNSFIFKKAMECEDQGAKKFATDDDHSCSKEKTANRQCLQEGLNNICAENDILFNKTERALQGILSTERLFCNKVSLDVEDVKLFADCTPEFFEKAENCAKTFRENFQTTTLAERDKSTQFCDEYEEARECINKTRTDHCQNFEKDVPGIIGTINNPFSCPSHAVRNGMSTLLLLAASIVVFLFFS